MAGVEQLQSSVPAPPAHQHTSVVDGVHLGQNIVKGRQTTRWHCRVPEAQPQQQPAPGMQAATPIHPWQSIQQHPLSVKRAGTPVQEQQPKTRQRLGLELQDQQQQQQQPSSSGSSGDSGACSSRSTQLNVGGRDEAHDLSRGVVDGMGGVSKAGTDGAASASLQSHSSERINISA